LNATEAAATLGISVASLYAYVSRGLIRSEEAPGPSRARRYRVEDVAELRRRKELRRKPEEVAAGALTWGMPVLESGITLIDGGRIYYRGHDATMLAQERTIEEVAQLLWTGILDGDTLFSFGAPTLAFAEQGNTVLKHADALVSAQVTLPLMSAADPAAYDLSPEALGRAGRRIMQRFTAFVAGAEWNDAGVVATLQAGWNLPEDDVARLLNAALILSADHELNVSAFTVRCVASAGAPLYAAVAAGLAAIQGNRHGGATLRIEALLDEAATPANAGATLTQRLRRGDALPGIGHTLYPEGDPRGRLLLDLLGALRRDQASVALAQAVIEAAVELNGHRPTHDFALVVLCRALELPSGTALQLFALGRCLGWIAHAIEEYDRDRLIRPRARYTGPTTARRP
jgi:citrate synthase